MRRGRRPLFLALLSACCHVHRSEAFLGIPGSIASENGYDSGGTEPICWLTPVGRAPEASTQAPSMTENPLLSGVESIGAVELLSRCPNGTHLDVFLPEDIGKNGPLTQRTYSFVVNGTLDLRQWPADRLVTDQKTMKVAVHIVLCDLRSPGFCSPFLHFNTNSTDSVAFGDRHEGNHIDSNFVVMPIHENQLQTFQTTVPVQVNEPGTFSVVAGLMFFLSNKFIYPEPLYLGSVANMPTEDSDKILDYQNQPTILYTTDNAELVSYIMIGLVGGVMLFLLYHTVKYRKEQVLMLTQGYFLIAMLCAGIVAIVGSIFFNPKNDLYCNMLGPMLVLPIHVFYSIILGRLWRIHAVISPLLLLTLEREDTLTTRVCNLLNRLTTCGNPKKLRRRVTNWQLARVVAFLSLPQIILQILALIISPNELTYQIDSSMTNGSVICDSFQNYDWPGVCSAVLLVVQFGFMWILARQSQDLPSLFNEAAIIFDLTLISVIIMTVAGIVIIMTDGPTTSPNIQYIIGVMGALAMILNTSLKLVLPKLRMVWRGDTVVVTKLIADHQKTRNRSTVFFEEYVSPSEFKEEDGASDSSSVVLVETQAESVDSEVDEDELRDTSEPLQSMAGSIGRIKQSVRDFQSENDSSSGSSNVEHGSHADSNVDHDTPRRRSALAEATQGPSEASCMRSKRTIFSGYEASRRTLFAARRGTPRGFNSMRNGMFSAVKESVRNLTGDAPASKLHHSVRNFEIDYNPNARDRIRISEDEPPTRRLLLRMVDVQRLLTHANRTVLGGFALPKEDWHLVKEAVVELGSVFGDDVQFAWQVDQSQSVGQDRAEQRAAVESSQRAAWRVGQSPHGQQTASKGAFMGTSQNLERQVDQSKLDEKKIAGITGAASMDETSQKVARQVDRSKLDEKKIAGISASMETSQKVARQVDPSQIDGRKLARKTASMETSQKVARQGGQLHVDEKKIAGIAASTQRPQKVVPRVD